MLRKYGVATVVPVKVWATDGILLAQPVWAAGDVQISKDGAVYANTTNLPVAVGKTHTLTLTATELQAARISIVFSDQDGPAFADQVIEFDTYGNASAQFPGDLDFLDASVASRASSAEISALNNLSAAEVKTQVNEVLNVDAKPELTARPAASAPLGDKITFLAMHATNSYAATDPTETLYADDDVTPVSTRPVTKTESLVRKGKAV